MGIEEVKSCRSCGLGELIPIISLGNQYITDFVDKDNLGCAKAPLDLILCQNCKLLQLKHNAPPESMWGDQYWYKSGISTTIKNDLKDIVQKTQQLCPLEENDLLIDIGCNDGTLLSFYDRDKKLTLVGFEPS